MARVLKIDVVIDESGQGRRAASELEASVKKVEAAGNGVAAGFSRSEEKLKAFEQAADAAEESAKNLASSSAYTATEVVGLGLAIGGMLAVVGAAGAAIYELGNYVKDASEYYIEQSGVLEVNQKAVDSLAKSWDAVRFSIGEAVIGGAGDFQNWIHATEAGLILVGSHISAAIELYEKLAKVSNPSYWNPFDSGDTPGIDTTKRNPKPRSSWNPFDLGGLPGPGTENTSFGEDEEWRKRQKDPWRGGNDPLGLKVPTMDASIAEMENQAAIARIKKENAILDAQAVDSAKELQRLYQDGETDLATITRIKAEHIKLENDMNAAIQRTVDAYRLEITLAEKANAVRIKEGGQDTRDDFMRGSMTPEDFQKYQIGVKADRQIAEIDPRTANAEKLKRTYQAEKELALIQMRQASEGMTQGIADDLNHFRAVYADVIGSLPITFKEILPEIVGASGALRDSMTGDLNAVSSAAAAAAQQYTVLGQAASKADIAAGLTQLGDAYADAGFHAAIDPNITRLRRAQTGGILARASGGMVETHYLAGGGSMGTDTVPAMLTPGEGVLSRTGMSALDRLNAGGTLGRGGMTIEKGAVVIDARGAQFADEASLAKLAQRVGQQLDAMAQRVGG
jgi:hypothetical protein